MNVDDIDWNDPIAANKLLREKLAMLEMQQGNHSSRPEHIDGGYDFDDEEYEEEDYEPMPRQRLAVQKQRAPRRSKGTTGGAKPGKRANRTFDNSRCQEIDRGNQALVRRLAQVHTRTERSSVMGATPRSKKIGSAGINRKKKQSKIDRENARIASRLRSMRGSSSIKATRRSKKNSKTFGPMPMKQTTRRRRRVLHEAEWQD